MDLSVLPILSLGLGSGPRAETQNLPHSKKIVAAQKFVLRLPATLESQPTPLFCRNSAFDDLMLLMPSALQPAFTLSDTKTTHPYCEAVNSVQPPAFAGPQHHISGLSFIGPLQQSQQCRLGSVVAYPIRHIAAKQKHVRKLEPLDRGKTIFGNTKSAVSMVLSNHPSSMGKRSRRWPDAEKGKRLSTFFRDAGNSRLLTESEKLEIIRFYQSHNNHGGERAEKKSFKSAKNGPS